MPNRQLEMKDLQQLYSTGIKGEFYIVRYYNDAVYLGHALHLREDNMLRNFLKITETHRKRREDIWCLVK